MRRTQEPGAVAACTGVCALDVPEQRAHRAVLHDPDNNILNGASIDDGVRPWDVSYRLPPRYIDPEKAKAADADAVFNAFEAEPQPETDLTCRDTNDPQYWADRLRAADKGDCERLLDAMFDLRLGMRAKGIPTPGADARFDEAWHSSKSGSGSTTCRFEATTRELRRLRGFLRRSPRMMG